MNTIARLKKYGTTVYRTDLDGHVLVKSDGNVYSVVTTRGIEHLDALGQLQTVPYHACRFVAHQYANVFYPIDCRYTPNIEPQNRICFGTEDEAVDTGFVKYAKC